MRTLWPHVAPNDDGIRPAGKPDECFYCRQKVGTPHGRECVIVTQRVELRIEVKPPDSTMFTGQWTSDEPHYWDKDDIEYRYNEGTWCADNLISDDYHKHITWSRPDAHDLLLKLCEGRPDVCTLCPMIVVHFVRMVDATPRRELRGQDARAN